MAKRKQNPRLSGPEQSGGGPVADPYFHAASAESMSLALLRLGRDVHLFGDKTSPAAIFSARRTGSPDTASVALMGLNAQQQLLLQASERRWDQPFPGVTLGSLVPFQNPPSTNPVLAGLAPLTHHAHRVESRSRTRNRFGRA